jgi:hypothetical protein
MIDALVAVVVNKIVLGRQYWLNRYDTGGISTIVLFEYPEPCFGKWATSDRYLTV